MEYGLIQIEYYDLNNTEKELNYTFSCKEFLNRTYLYINPMLSDYILRHNKEFEDGNSLSYNVDQKELEELDLTILKNVSSFKYDITYMTNFKMFCKK